MTEELTRSLRVIHRLERSIRVLELVRDGAQEVVNEAIGCDKRQGGSAEINPTLAKARAHVTVCNRTIIRAKARIEKLERGD
jgi:hypothetical protein